VEERERAQAQGCEDGEEDRFDDAELPPPMYSVKPTTAEKGKGPATTATPSTTGDSKRTATATSSTSALPNSAAAFAFAPLSPIAPSSSRSLTHTTHVTRYDLYDILRLSAHFQELLAADLARSAWLGRR